MDWITNRAAHKGFLGVTVGEEICTDLDYADDVSLLASMLEMLVLALAILHEESSQIGLEINWSKTKLQVFDDTSTPHSKVSVNSTIIIIIIIRAFVRRTMSASELNLRRARTGGCRLLCLPWILHRYTRRE